MARLLPGGLGRFDSPSLPVRRSRRRYEITLKSEIIGLGIKIATKLFYRSGISLPSTTDDTPIDVGDFELYAIAGWLPAPDVEAGTYRDLTGRAYSIGSGVWCFFAPGDA